MKIRKFFYLLYILLNINLVLSNNSEYSREEKILSRHRRYLIFPAGSSLQLVYDLGIPFMEFTAIGVVGVTGAMAWELPSEPVYIDQDLQEAYSKGGLPLLDRIDDNDYTGNNINRNNNGSTDKISNKIDTAVDNYGNGIKDSVTINQQQTKRPPATVSQYQRPIVDNYYTNRFPDRYYKSTNKINYITPQRQPQQQSQLYSQRPQQTNSLDQISNKIDYYFSYVDKLFSTISDMTNRNYNKWNPQKLTPMTNNNNYRVYAQRPSESSPPSYFSNPQKIPFRKSSYRRNFIHPVFGRSISDDLATTKTKSSIPNEHVKFFNVHRTTRHTLYKKIAALMNMRNLNGMECVLRALCETGQNSNDFDEPAPFLLEILRAIFSLPPESPEYNTASTHPVHKMYDAAYFSKKNCAEVHKKCAGSIWGPEFQF